MEKLLTVSIAAYNIEEYLPQCLNSLVIPEIMDDLEVFIVDDGSTDATVKIADEYAAKYPRTFIAVHKENGGYGTTVNYSIAHATGKYFRTLDGDDWYDKYGLIQSIDSLRKTDADVVVMPSLRSIAGGELRQIHFPAVGNGNPVEIKDLNGKSTFGHKQICYRTETLKQSGLTLPAHMLYTDQYYSVIPFAKARTIQSIGSPVYCYRAGRDGQSISRENRIKHTEENAEICRQLCEFCRMEKEKGNENLPYLLGRVSGVYLEVVHMILLRPISRQTLDKLKEFDHKVSEQYPDVYRSALEGKTKMSLLARLFKWTNYGAYWLLKIFPGGVPNRY